MPLNMTTIVIIAIPLSMTINIITCDHYSHYSHSIKYDFSSHIIVFKDKLRVSGMSIMSLVIFNGTIIFKECICKNNSRMIVITHQSNNHQPINPPVNKSMNQPINQPINQSSIVGLSL